jgi:hypothetical protein
MNLNFRKQQGKLLFKLVGAIAAIAFIVFGKLATVEPITQYTEFKKSGSSTFTAEFHFKTEDGRQVVQKHSFPEEVLADFKAGKPVRIYYLPSDTSTFVFESDKPGWTLVIGGFVLLVAALVFA